MGILDTGRIEVTSKAVDEKIQDAIGPSVGCKENYPGLLRDLAQLIFFQDQHFFVCQELAS